MAYILYEASQMILLQPGWRTTNLEKNEIWIGEKKEGRL